jgi:hypothetical protein
VYTQVRSQGCISLRFVLIKDSLCIQGGGKAYTKGGWGEKKIYIYIYIRRVWQIFPVVKAIYTAYVYGFGQPYIY